MIPVYKKRMTIAGAVFVAAYAAAAVVAVAANPSEPGLAMKVAQVLATAAGVALLCTFWLYIKAKGRSSWWMLMILLSVIGLFVLAFLKDRGSAGEEGTIQRSGLRQVLSRLLLSSAQLIVALVAVFAVYMGWMSWQGRQLKALCAEANEGVAVSALPALAEKYGFDRRWVEHGVRDRSGAGWVVYVPSSATMGDVACEIRYDKTRVLSAEMQQQEGAR